MSNSTKLEMEEDELDGLPVFGADEDEGDLDSKENKAMISISPRDNEPGPVLLKLGCR